MKKSTIFCESAGKVINRLTIGPENQLIVDGRPDL